MNKVNMMLILVLRGGAGNTEGKHDKNKILWMCLHLIE